MLNRVVLMGRLTREPELRYTPQNTAVCTITLAVERDFARQGEQREADFIDVVCWRNTAEFVTKWFRKGQLVAVEGRLQSRKWKDKFEQNRVTFEVVADNVFFAERNNDAQRSDAGSYAPKNDYSQSSSYNTRPAPAQQAPSAQNFNQMPDSGFSELDDDDDVPF